MNITRAAIEKNRITVVALILILIAGINTFRTMPRAEDPGFTIRWALVMTYFPGASPERVEMLVTDKLEKAIQEMPEIDFISSESRTGVSIISIGIVINNRSCPFIEWPVGYQAGRSKEAELLTITGSIPDRLCPAIVSGINGQIR